MAARKTPSPKEPTAVQDWGNFTKPFQLKNRRPIHHQPGSDERHDALWRYARGHNGFYGWLRLVDCRLAYNLFPGSGRGVLNLTRQPWRKDYSGRVPPREAADVVFDEISSVLGIDPP